MSESTGRILGGVLLGSLGTAALINLFVRDVPLLPRSTMVEMAGIGGGETLQLAVGILLIIAGARVSGMIGGNSGGGWGPSDPTKPA